MKINRVYLENFRIHEKWEGEFVPGINLLLGLNGKGKSSILEAIGYAVFGASLRGKGKDAIRYGAKSGKIIVEFTGMDSVDYVVEKIIPGGETFYQKGVSPELGLSAEKRKQALQQLCGIRGDLKGIYENVIIAKQNEFIRSFQAKDTEREKIFNEVFNTEIYRQLFEGYTKDVFDRYKNQLEVERQILENAKTTLKDPDEIEKKLKDEQEELETKRIALESSEKSTWELDSLIKQYEQEQNQWKQLENNIQHLEKNRRDQEETEKNWRKKIKQSEEAVEILRQNLECYQEYHEKERALEIFRKTFWQTEQAKNYYLLRENYQKDLAVHLEKIRGELTETKLMAENLEERKKEYTEQQQIWEQELREIKQQAELSKKELESTEYLLQKVEHYEEQLQQWRKRFQEMETEKKTLEQSIQALENSIQMREKEDYGMKILTMEQYEKEWKEMSDQREQEKVMLQTNKEADEILRGGYCPYLGEPCLNLAGEDVGKIFQSKIAGSEKNIQELTEKMQELEQKIQKKAHWIKQELFVQAEKAQCKEKQQTLREQSLKLELAVEKIASREKEYLEFLKKNEIEHRDQLLEIRTKIRGSLENMRAEEVNENLQNLSVKILKNQNLSVEIFQKTKKIEKNRTETERKIQEIHEELEQKKQILSRYDREKEAITALEQRKKELEGHYAQYISHEKSAGEKAEYEEKLMEILETLRKIEVELVMERQNAEALEIRLASTKITKLREEQTEQKQQMLELTRQSGEIRNRIQTLRAEREEIREKQKQIRTTEQSLKKLEKKLKLTESFREQIKSMGKEMTKNILLGISAEASENFRRITGRPQYIRWSNDDRDRYLVSLCDDKNEVRFDNLSGGEQVAVAISIRSAISNLFTAGRFSIFDEPTSNLDPEKRKSLAESLGEILKNLEQSIIVTHDDTFREMAQKVIEL